MTASARALGLSFDAVLAAMVTCFVNMLPTRCHDRAGRREC
jgi:hypothetical protein